MAYTDIELLKKRFPKGSYIHISWYGNKRVIALVDDFIYNEDGIIQVKASFGVNAGNVLRVGENAIFGISDNNVRFATQNEIAELHCYLMGDDKVSFCEVIINTLTRDEILDVMKYCLEQL